MQKRISVELSRRQSLPAGVRAAVLFGFVLSLTGLPGCEKLAPQPTAEEVLAQNVASLQRDLAEFVKLTDDVETLAETMPVVKQTLKPLRAQEAIAQSCIDELTRRIDTLSDDIAAQTDPRTSGPPAIHAFLNENLKLWIEFTSNTMSVYKFLEAARAEPGLADHQVESWSRRFEIQRKKLAALAPATEP